MTPEISSQDITKIIVDGDAEVLVTQSKTFGEAVQTAGLTKSQIRGIFGTVRQIEAAWDKADSKQNLRRVLLLKPRLAYQAAREPKVKPLTKVLTDAIDLVAKGQNAAEQKRRFDFFVDLFESILAYHTAAGGR
jgi:CRISPR-associated protein Csm2